MPPIISIQNLGKKYWVGHQSTHRERYSTLRDVLARNAKDLLRKTRDILRGQPLVQGDEVEEFWALKNISFDVNQGEVVGIIGRNGAGKSTLLKILSRITEPTEGQVTLRGRVASLLEVGTGFHPELTGRENIFLNGAILGMKRAEIRKKFDEIVAFAEIERFLDTPVKRYSSGMYVRLAFAVAAHLEPEILIVDEVLAVGDAEFQKRCLGKMESVSRTEGRTVLFVSHNADAVSVLTTRCVLLSEGKLIVDGPSRNVLACYLSVKNSEDYFATPHGTYPQVTALSVKTSDAHNIHRYGEPLEVFVTLYTPAAVSGAVFSIQLCDSLDQPVVHAWAFDSESAFLRSPGEYHLSCRFPSPRLYQGRYTVTTHLSESKLGRYFECIRRICPFEVTMHGISRPWPWEDGACRYIEDFCWSVGNRSSLR